MEKGFILLHREIQDDWRWLSEPFTKSQAWIDLLLTANYTESSYEVRGIKKTVRRGEIGRCEEHFASNWKWSRKKVQNFLKSLEKEQKIILHRVSPVNTIEIVDYDQWSNRGAPEEQQKSTYNKREIKKRNISLTRDRENFVPNFPEWLDKELWNEFLVVRKSLGTPLITERAVTGILKKLQEFEGKQAGWGNQSLQNSVEGSWKSVYCPSIASDPSPSTSPRFKKAGTGAENAEILNFINSIESTNA